MAEADFTEVWRPVVGYEELYSVSNLGRVRSEVRGKGFRSFPLIMHAKINRAGREELTLCANAHKVCVRVHTLVAEAFLGTRPTGLEVNHKDGDCRNNRPENLEYVTSAENHRHAIELGLYPIGDRHHSRSKPHLMARGERHGNAKLTNASVREIRKLLSEGNMTQLEIGKRFGVCNTVICKIKIGENWKHIS